MAYISFKKVVARSFVYRENDGGVMKQRRRCFESGGGKGKKKKKRRSEEKAKMKKRKFSVLSSMLLTSLQVPNRQERLHGPQTAAGSCQLAQLSMDFAGISAPDSASSQTRSNHRRSSQQLRSV